MRYITFLFLMAVMTLFSGCASMLTPNATDKFTCADKPNGVCADVNTVYDNRFDIDALKERLKVQKLGDRVDYIAKRCNIHKISGVPSSENDYESCVNSAGKEYDEQINTMAIEELERAQRMEVNYKSDTDQVIKLDKGEAKRSPDEIQKIWIAPYMNDNGDLVGSHYVFAVLNPSAWALKVFQVHDIDPLNDDDDNDSDVVDTTITTDEKNNTPSPDTAVSKQIGQGSRNGGVRTPANQNIQAPTQLNTQLMNELQNNTTIKMENN